LDDNVGETMTFEGGVNSKNGAIGKLYYKRMGLIY
jgi:hypothetical protein